jgi:hypothetical protein
VERATARSKKGNFRGYGVAEAPPLFKAGWSGCALALFSLFVHFDCG